MTTFCSASPSGSFPSACSSTSPSGSGSSVRVLSSFVVRVCDGRERLLVVVVSLLKFLLLRVISPSRLPFPPSEMCTSWALRRGPGRCHRCRGTLFPWIWFSSNIPVCLVLTILSTPIWRALIPFVCCDHRCTGRPVHKGELDVLAFVSRQQVRCRMCPAYTACAPHRVRQ